MQIEHPYFLLTKHFSFTQIKKIFILSWSYSGQLILNSYPIIIEKNILKLNKINSLKKLIKY
jgi:hypothetical protein